MPCFWSRAVWLSVCLLAATGCAKAPEETAAPERPAVRPGDTAEAPVDSVMDPAVDPGETPPSTPYGLPERAPVQPTPPSEPGTRVLPTPPAPSVPSPPTPPEPRSARSIAAAEAFWTSFQSAVRAGDRDAIEAGLSANVYVGDDLYARGSPEVQQFIDSLTEDEAIQEATLGVSRLRHQARGSLFEATATYALSGQTVNVVLIGGLREVAPGDWRLYSIDTQQ